MELLDYTRYHETKVHEQQGFSYNTYLCTIPLDFPRVGLHWHEQAELIYIKKGNGTVSVNLIPYPVSSGAIVPVLPGELHGIEVPAGGYMEYENIIFSLSMLDAKEDEWCRRFVLEPLETGRVQIPRPLIPGTELHRQAASCLDAADAVCGKRPAGYPLLVKAELYRLLYFFYAHGTLSDGRPVPLPAEKVKNILSWVREHYSEKVTVEEAAAAAGYSAAHFMRFFKNETGQTFTEYLNDYRLASAAYTIAETGESISRIAEECGFESLSYFSRSFRAKYGMSPRQMRASGREDS